MSETSLDQSLLRIRDISVRFAGIVALDRVSFDVARGQICGLIGPNGAGKTTLFNCLSRLYTPEAGEIMFDGHPLLATPPHIDRDARHRPHVSEPGAVPHHVGAPEYSCRAHHARTSTGFVSDALRCRLSAAKRGNSRAKSMN